MKSDTSNVSTPVEYFITTPERRRKHLLGLLKYHRESMAVLCAKGQDRTWSRNPVYLTLEDVELILSALGG